MAAEAGASAGSASGFRRTRGPRRSCRLHSGRLPARVPDCAAAGGGGCSRPSVHLWKGLSDRRVRPRGTAGSQAEGGHAPRGRKLCSLRQFSPNLHRPCWKKRQITMAARIVADGAGSGARGVVGCGCGAARISAQGRPASGSGSAQQSHSLLSRQSTSVTLD